MKKHKNEPPLEVLEIEIIELLSTMPLDLKKIEALKKQIERIKNGY